MKLRSLAIVLAALLSFIADASAWEYQGHRMVGSIADHLLTPNVRDQIKSILGFDLRTAAPWADCVRSVTRLDDGTFRYAPSKPEYRVPCTAFETPSGIARMEDYVARNWHTCVYAPKHGCHETYHFTDVAIQRDEYRRDVAGTSDHDIVAAVNAAIAVLRDRPAPPPFAIRDKAEALLLLAHFVGDLHQPLHVGAVYLTPAGQLIDPDQGGAHDAAAETAGGNFITDGDTNLHAEWDHIADQLGDVASPDLITRARAVAATPGAIDGFATAWATDTLRAAQTAFADLTFAGSGKQRWQARFKDRDGYWKEQDRVKLDQMAKGGARLAQVLNMIWPATAPTVEKVTACTTIEICYCVTAANRDAIATDVTRVRQLISDQRAAGKSVGYLSIPLSTLGGGYIAVNQEVAARTKDRIEQRFGPTSVWILNPGAEGHLPAGASGADYMYMWTQILEGRGGFGEDFDFFYFTGPSDFAHFFDLNGRQDADRIAAYFDQRLAADAGLKSLVEAGKMSRAGFRNYYAFRASVAFSLGSHDEWNIARRLNEQRRKSAEYGIGNQLGILFDGRAVTPGAFEDTAANGTTGKCQ